MKRLVLSKKPLRLPHLKRCGLFVGFLGCSEKSEVAKQLLHPKGCSLISLTLLILFSLPLVSSLSIEIKENFQPGETLLASLEGNFLSPIKPEQVYFYSGRTQIPLISDIARIGDKYYLYALLPNQAKNYSLIMKNAHYYENGEEHTGNIEKSFYVSGNITDFSVYPGFIIMKNESYLVLESKNQKLDVILEFLDETRIISVPAGNKIKVPLKASGNSTITTLSLSALSTSYEIPVAILSTSKEKESINITIEETEKFRFSKSEYNFSVNEDKEETFTISLLNLGNEIKNINLTVSSDSIIISPREIETLEESESKSVQLKILAQETGIFIANVKAKSGNLSASADIIINSLKKDAVLPVQDGIDSCISLNGIICSENEECAGILQDSLEGECCMGECAEKKSYTGIIVGIILILVVIAGLFLLYKKSKFRKQKPEEILEKKTREFESRISPEVRNSLSRA